MSDPIETAFTVLASPYPIPANETDRLAALDRLKLVGTPRSLDFDSVLALALQTTGCRAGLIGLMQGDRHWFKAESGLGCSELPRCDSLGNHVLLQTEPMIIEDLTRDARFQGNPLVTERGVRFYAGVALAVEDGLNVGTLCLTDRSPRPATPELASALRHLGRVIETLLETHAKASNATALVAMAEARERDNYKATRILKQSAEMAKIGAWEFDVESQSFSLSDEAYRIHEIEIGAYLHIDEMQARFPLSDLHGVATRYKNAQRSGVGYEIMGEIVTARGTRRWAHRIVEVEKQDGKVVRIFGAVRDMTAEHEAEQALWRSAHYDTLTGAPNRHYWTLRLDQAFAQAVAGQTGLTILMFDLDGFKEINDTRGHAVGDAVLRDVASRLGKTVPADAFHARLGGDEFAVLLQTSLTAVEIETIVNRVLAAIQAPIVVGTLRLQIAGTFGSASFPTDAPTAADLMQKADIALYQAKRSHRSSFVSFRAEIGDLFTDKHQALDLVAAAIEQNRLVPFYQPKVDLKTGRATGFEALCRIEAEDGTILGPSQFLPALQDPVVSARIGAAMLDLVTADIASWLAEDLAPGRVALNVTSSDFAKGDLDRRILGRLAALDLPATAIEIEVTENTILGPEAQVVGETLHAMRAEGIVIALDDFGTGYASLTHLRDAPIHYIKLDRSFIAGLGRGADSAIIVRSIVDLGHSLGMRVVAEGIETKGQAEFLRAIGCDEGQGFLFGRPASRSAMRDILEERRRIDATRLRDPTQKGYFNFLARRFGP